MHARQKACDMKLTAKASFSIAVRLLSLGKCEATANQKGRAMRKPDEPG